MANTYDVIICGAGSGGGFLAGEIAPNASVLLLDWGPYIGGTPNFGVGSPQRRAFATQINLGTFIPDGMYTINQGSDAFQYPLYADSSNPSSVGVSREAKVVGGGSFINVGAWIRPRAVDWDGFAQETGVVGWTKAAFEPYFDYAEQVLNVHRDVPANWNPASVLYQQTAQSMGIPVFATASNRKNCIFCGHRNDAGMPCKYDALMSTTITQIPKAIAAGAVLAAQTKVVQVNISNNTATGVTYIDANGNTVTANAKKLVVLSAGAIGTPLILFNSGVNLINSNVGKHLRAHPGMSVEGFMPSGTWNVDRGYQWNAYHYGMVNGQPIDTLVYTASFPNTSWLACQVGNFGLPYKNFMRQFSTRIGVWIFLLNPNVEGRVVGRVDAPVIDYPMVAVDGMLEPKSLSDMTTTIKQTAAVLRAMGCVTTDPNPLEPPSQLEQIITLKVPAAGLFHSQSTCRAGSDPASSVLDSNCMSHDIANLMCCDASAIPYVIGANSNAMVMAVAARASDYVNSQILNAPSSNLIAARYYRERSQAVTA
jgi:choline dehydrogenase-like flavoprotein